MRRNKVNEVNAVDVVERLQPGYRSIGSYPHKKRNSHGPIPEIDKMYEDWLRGRDVDKYFDF